MMPTPMSFRVQTIDYDDPHGCLREITRLIRTGLPRDGTLFDQQEAVLNAIQAVRKEGRRHPGLFSEIEQLKIMTLEAEFYQQNGKPRESQRALEPAWQKLKPDLDGWGPTRPLEPTGDRKLLRQKIWVLLHYVFYRYYRIGGHHKEALDHFLRIREIIDKELRRLHKRPELDYHPHGTLAICHYFIGLCYRELRSFGGAEFHFLEAQKETSRRLARELGRPDISDSEREYELLHKDVFCGRVASGLGWIALQQGALVRAELLLVTAENFVVNSRQESLKLFIASLKWMAVRRRVSYDDPLYQEAIEGLTHCFELYRKAGDMTQMRRCASELLRAYLDLAEFEDKDKTLRSMHLQDARKWLTPLEKAAENPKDMLRYHLYHARLLMVAGDMKKADDVLSGEARTLSLRERVPQRALPVLESVLLFKQGHLNEALAGLKRCLSRTLTLTEIGDKRDNRVRDPVIEAECHVLLSQVYAAQKDYVSASRCLDEWSVIGQFVENHYLRHLAQRVREVVVPALGFHVDFDFEIFASDTNEVKVTLLSRIQQFETFLLDSMNARYNLKIGEQADAYGIDRFKYARKFGGIKKARKSHPD